MTKNDLNTSEYHSHYQTYINACNAGELIDSLETNREVAATFFKSISIEKQAYRYAEGKWTPKEILQHIIDTERIFSYRALRFARKDKTDLPGFDENGFADNSNANDQEMNSLVEDFIATRNSTITLFKSFNAEILLSVGTASNAQMSVRALGFVNIGHTVHHCNVVKERYL